MFEEVFIDGAAVLAAARDQDGILWVPRRDGQSSEVRLLGEWSDNKWLNTPGPIYCGQTDNCGTGPLEAPDNIEVDGESFQILYRQPVNFYELEQVVLAA